MSAVHDFRTSQIESDRDSPPFFNAAYRQLFGLELEDVHRFSGQSWQRAGVDVALYLSGLRVRYADEKLRRKGTASDVLLELHHDHGEGDTEPGWAKKSTMADYFVYGWRESGEVWLLESLALRSALLMHEIEWLAKARAKQDGFRLVVARNTKWDTHSIVVPAPVVAVTVGGLRTVVRP